MKIINGLIELSFFAVAMATGNNPCTLPECNLECLQDQIVVSFDIEYLKSEFGSSDYSLIHMGSWHYDKDWFYFNITKMVPSCTSWSELQDQEGPLL